jgi:hypothetical protein
MGFRSLQHLRAGRSTQSRGVPARYDPPPGFGYPLDGFRPSGPCRFCFTPAALLGFTLRSLLLPEGFRRVPAAKDPHAVSPAVLRSARGGRPARQASASGLRPFRKSLAFARGFRPRDAGCSLGFRPFRVSRREASSGIRPNSSHALGGQAHEPQAMTNRAAECLSASAWRHSPPTSGRSLEQPS